MNRTELELKYIFDIVRMYHYHSCGFMSDEELFEIENGITLEDLHKKLYEIRCRAMNKTKDI